MEQLAERVGSFLASQTAMDEERQEVVTYGVLMFLHNGASLLLTVLFGVLAGVLPETLAALFAAAVLRHASGGAHLSSSLRCAVVTALTFLACGYLGGQLGEALSGQSVTLRLLVLLLPAAIGMATIVRRAPVAAENRPLSAGHRAKLRRLSLRLCLLFTAIFVAGGWIGNEWTGPVLLGFLWQCFSLTPAGHAVLHRVDQILTPAERG